MDYHKFIKVGLAGGGSFHSLPSVEWALQSGQEDEGQDVCVILLEKASIFSTGGKKATQTQAGGWETLECCLFTV